MPTKIWATGSLLIRFWATIDGKTEEITREQFWDYKNMGVKFEKQ